MKRLNLYILLTVFVISASGCWMPAPDESNASKTPQSAIEPPQQTLDVGPILNAHTQAINAAKNVFSSKNSGISPVENSELDRRMSLSGAWLNALVKRSDAAWTLLAMRIAEHNAGNIPYAVDLLRRIQNHPRDFDADDIFDYHIARLESYYAEAVDSDIAEDCRIDAVKRYARVINSRLSPYYHIARAEKIKTSLTLNIDISAELEKFIRDYPDYPERLAFQYEFARLRFAAGDTENAVALMQDIAFEHPWDDTARRADNWLADHHIAPKIPDFNQTFDHVSYLRRMRFWDDAQKAADEALPQYPESFQLMVQNARIAYERSDHAEAAERFEEILKKLGGEEKDNLKPRGVIAYLYRAYGYLGNREKAMQYHAENAARLSRNARIRATRDFALTCGALDTAYDKNIELGIPDNPKSLEYHAFLAYLTKNYEKARLYYTAAIPGLSGTYERRARYFLAQATLKQAELPKIENTGENSNQTDKNADNKSKKRRSKKKSRLDKITLPPPTAERAKDIFQKIIDENSGDYYAILAYSRLAELAPGFDPKKIKTPVFQTFKDDFKQHGGIKRPWNSEYTFDEKKYLADFRTLVDSYGNDIPELRRVEFFHEAELYRERNMLFRRLAIEIMGITKLARRPKINNLWTTKISADGHLVDNRRNDTGFWGIELDTFLFTLPSAKQKQLRQPIFERQTAIYDAGDRIRRLTRNTLIAFHDYYLSRRHTAVPKSVCGSPDSIDRCAVLYPHAFSDAVIKASRQNQITPDLIWAVMNIESAFNPDSVSHADAYGLLQIIPMTGYKISDAKKVDPFGPYDLIKPEVSISMGTWYFARILKKFHGYATLSMAAYNGGPHQVARWLTAYAENVEHDAFIELIPYNEARNYVKKGMARLLIFQRIDYSSPEHFFYIPNSLPQSFEPMPNY